MTPKLSQKKYLSKWKVVRTEERDAFKHKLCLKPGRECHPAAGCMTLVVFGVEERSIPPKSLSQILAPDFEQEMPTFWPRRPGFEATNLSRSQPEFAV